MYCSGCGRPVEAHHQACTACGRPVARVPVAVPACGRARRHAQTLGVLWSVYAAWSLLQWMVAATFLAGLFGGRERGWGRIHGPFGEGFPMLHMPWFVPIVTVFVILRSTLAIATGVGLLRRAPWARTLALVTAFLTVLKPITGTMLAIYTLWALLPASSAAEYGQMSPG